MSASSPPSSLGDLGAWWSAQGLSDETRRDFVEELFATIELHEMGIRAVRPRPTYVVLAATAEMCVSGRGERI